MKNKDFYSEIPSKIYFKFQISKHSIPKNSRKKLLKIFFWYVELTTLPPTLTRAYEQDVKIQKRINYDYVSNIQDLPYAVTHSNHMFIGIQWVDSIESNLLLH